MSDPTRNDEEAVPSRWRKKPVEVEAWQYLGPQVAEVRDDRMAWAAPEFAALRSWVGSKFTTAIAGSVTHGGPNQHCPAIRTLEGVMRVMPGDWVIKDVRGEFYPCKPSIFDATYEAVGSPRVAPMGDIPVRIRVGVSRWPDGWNVVAEVNGKRMVYDPTYATEAEAQVKADEASAVLREQFGLPPRTARNAEPGA